MRLNPCTQASNSLFHSLGARIQSEKQQRHQRPRWPMYKKENIILMALRLFLCVRIELWQTKEMPHQSGDDLLGLRNARAIKEEIIDEDFFPSVCEVYTRCKLP